MAADTAELRYAKGKTAEWLLNLIKSGVSIDERLLECVEWALGDFHNVLCRLEDALKGMPRKSGGSKIYNKLRELHENRRGHKIYDKINDLAEMHAFLDKPLLETI